MVAVVGGDWFVAVQRRDLFFKDLEQDEKSFYKKMQLSIQNKYDDIEHKKEVLTREYEELSEKCLKVNEEKLKTEKEKGSNSETEK